MSVPAPRAGQRSAGTRSATLPPRKRSGGAGAGHAGSRRGGFRAWLRTVPGFRSGTFGKQVVSILGYLVIALLLIAGGPFRILGVVSATLVVLGFNIGGVREWMHRSVPGYRTGMRGKQVVATLGYLLIGVFLYAGIQRGNAGLFVAGVWGIGLVLLTFDVGGVWGRIPGLRSVGPKVRAALGVVVGALGVLLAFNLAPADLGEPTPPPASLLVLALAIATAVIIGRDVNGLGSRLPRLRAGGPPARRTAAIVIVTLGLIVAFVVAPSEPVSSPITGAPDQAATSVEAYVRYMVPKLQLIGPALTGLSQQAEKARGHPSLLRDPLWTTQTSLLLGTLQRTGQALQGYSAPPPPGLQAVHEVVQQLGGSIIAIATEYGDGVNSNSLGPLDSSMGRVADVIAQEQRLNEELVKLGPPPGPTTASATATP